MYVEAWSEIEAFLKKVDLPVQGVHDAMWEAPRAMKV